MRKILILSTLIIMNGFATATNISVSNIYLLHEPDKPTSLRARFELKWENAWHNTKNYDAAWVFFRYQVPPRYQYSIPAKIAPTNHKMLMNHIQNAPDPLIQTSDDLFGLFVHPDKTYRGNVHWTMEVTLDTSIFSNQNITVWDLHLNVYAIEMVFIPEGAFYVGDLDTTLVNTAAMLFKSDAHGQYDGFYKIENENSEIEISPATGKLYYHANEPEFEGDAQGPIPAAFPKGVQAFYMMKYELKQGEYAAFLNSLGVHSQTRNNFGGKGYYSGRGTISIIEDRYIAEAPQRPCNFLSWDDAMAFADWSGLRPMTELEYTKASRGSQPPKHPREFNWGTNSKQQLQRYVNEVGDLVYKNGWDESQLNDSNRGIFGASYYWVMDLAGSLWERVISIGHPKGRAFQGTHGDGRLTRYEGKATNEDWPLGIEETGGYGYRGGGFYEYEMVHSNMNPHSPVAHRHFGAWSGGYRAIAYGSRFVRTVSIKK